MIILVWPWILLIIPLPLLARFLPRASISPKVGLKLPFLQENLAEFIFTSHASFSGHMRIRLLFATLAWICLVLAAARPQWLGDPVQLPFSGRDLMLALDISGSMEELDYKWSGRRISRLAAVQMVATKFVQRRDQDRIGLILFGTQAYLQTPLTFDGFTVAALLSEAVVGLAGRETAIGDAIALSIKHLTNQPAGQRVLVLFTDGENTAGALDPREAARLAAQAGIKIYTIGIGGGELGIRTPFGIQLLHQGVGFDVATLRDIAHLTGGRFFTATSREQLEKISAELDILEPNQRDQQTLRPQHELFVWPGALALLLSVGVFLMSWYPLDSHDK